MNTLNSTGLVTIAFLVFFTFGSVHAQGPGMNMNDKGSMMGNMNMDEMSGMRRDCMQTKKDGKMCDQQMMVKCQEKTGKEECKKMMTQMKKDDKIGKDKM